MLIVDAHQDIAWNWLSHGRDYRTSALKHRQREAGAGTERATIGLPDALLGRVAIVFSTLFALPAHAKGLPGKRPLPVYHNERQAYEQALQQMDYYQRLADEDDRVRLVRERSDLEVVLASWDPGTEVGQHRQGLVVLMEGADPILEPKQFEEWYERGVRIVGPAWSATRYSGGTGAPGGLTHLGHDLLGVMEDFNAILDVSHMAERAFYEALECYEGVVIASHSNPRRFRDSDRHLSDEMIENLAQRGGVMGIVLYNRFLSDTWAKGDAELPLSIVAQAIDHVCQITGSARHVGIGSDFDGGFGAGSTPAGLETSGDLLEIATLLKERGYEADDIEAIMGGNMLRQLKQVL